MVNNLLIYPVTELLRIRLIRSQDISTRDKQVLLPLLCLISPPNGGLTKWDGGSTCHICGNTFLRYRYMLKFKNPTLGNVTQSRTALAVFAATLLVGGSVSEASAKSHR